MNFQKFEISENLEFCSFIVFRFLADFVESGVRGAKSGRDRGRRQKKGRQGVAAEKFFKFYFL